MARFGEIFPIRYLIVGTAFLGFMFNYGLRVNMSIAIVAMVNHTAILQLSQKANQTSPFENRRSECLSSDPRDLSPSAWMEGNNGSSHAHGGLMRATDVDVEETLWPSTTTIATTSSVQEQVSSSSMEQQNEADKATSKKKSSDGPLVWDEAVQGLVLSSFYWGYLMTQMPGGRLAEILGPKHVLSVSLLGTALVTMFMPLAARAHYVLVMALRITMGLLEGATYPAISVLLAKWAPVAERSRMTAIVYVGSMFGTFVILPIAGLLIDSFGWESVFYFSGLSTIAWGVLWMAIVKDDPAEHPWITEAELKTIKGPHYIPLKATDSGIDAETAIGVNRVASRQNKAIPWRAMARCKPLWALAIASAGHGYGFTVILSLMPTYLKTMQGFDIKSNGTLSALPYLGRTIFALVFSVFIDWQLKKARFSRTTLRKVAVSIAYVTAGTALLLTSFSGCNASLTVALLIMTPTAMGADYSGTAPSYLDIASNYAGTAMGFANGAFTCSAIIAPIVSGYLLKGQQTLATWGLIFRIAGFIYIAVDIVYLFWGSAEEQPWNRQEDQHGEALCPSGDAEGTNTTLLDGAGPGISDQITHVASEGDEDTNSGIELAEVHSFGGNKVDSSSSSSSSDEDEIDSSVPVV